MQEVMPITDAEHRESGHIVKIHADGGCAFVRPESGGEDVYVTLIEFYQNRMTYPKVGLRVRFRRYIASNGRYRATDLVVIEQESVVVRKASTAGRSKAPLRIVSAPAVGCWQDGHIKWYDPDKRYGFVSLDEMGFEVFVNRATLVEWGIRCTQRIENLPVQVEIGRGRKANYPVMVTKISLRT